MKINYHNLMLDEIKQIQKKNKRPKLLLHSCCAPCSTYVIQTLSQHFDLEIYFFNPNIDPDAEYLRRLDEQIRLVEEMGLAYQVIGLAHSPQSFYEAVKGLEALGEGTERCFSCFALRLKKTAIYAWEHQFDYFTTTLTISPLKNSSKLNEIGASLGKQYGVNYLPADFKKNNGYLHSTMLSKEYDLYRQDYCGCVFSKVRVREIEPRDNEALYQLIRETLEDYALNIPGTAYFDPELNALSYHYENEEKGRYFVLVDKQEQVIGGAGIAPLAGKTCELQKLYLDQNYRGKGLSRLLMEKVFDYARQHYEEMYLETHSGLKEAYELYLKLGFKNLAAPHASNPHMTMDIWMLKEL